MYSESTLLDNIFQMVKTKTEIQTKFGQAIKERRAEIKMNQEDLAGEADLDRTYISGIERGVRNPSLINIKKIADALKIKISKLFEMTGN